MTKYWIEDRNWLLLKYGKIRKERIDINKYENSKCELGMIKMSDFMSNMFWYE